MALVGYARVSTDDQRLDLQIDALTKAGVLPQNLHTDTVSAAAKRRVGLENAFLDCRKGDTLIVWRLDRLARSIRDLLTHTEKLAAKGCNFRSLTENFDTATAGGRFMFHIIGALADFERQLVIERTQAGMAALKRRGVAVGRKKVMTAKAIQQANAMLRKGETMKAVAKHFRVKPQTLYNVGVSKRRALRQRKK
jgi:DNA invertase Pin-like site-specific DNA recombinase